jgi:hypothetical protein
MSVDEVGSLLSGDAPHRAAALRCLLTAAEEALQETRSAHQATGRGAAVMWSCRRRSWPRSGASRSVYAFGADASHCRTGTRADVRLGTIRE